MRFQRRSAGLRREPAARLASPSGCRYRVSCKVVPISGHVPIVREAIFQGEAREFFLVIPLSIFVVALRRPWLAVIVFAGSCIYGLYRRDGIIVCVFVFDSISRRPMTVSAA